MAEKLWKSADQDDRLYALSVTQLTTSQQWSNKEHSLGAEENKGLPSSRLGVPASVFPPRWAYSMLDNFNVTLRKE